jgi:hypothetical protein
MQLRTVRLPAERPSGVTTQRSPRRRALRHHGVALSLLALVSLAACTAQPRAEAGAPGLAPAAWPGPVTTVGPSSQGASTAVRGDASDASGASSTLPVSTGAGTARGRILLDPNGLGNARFGDAPAPVIAAVSRQLGKPSRDTGWQPRGAVYGVCPGTRTRVVTWGQFSALFSNGPTPYGPAGRQHFFLWSVEGNSRRTPAATAAGIGIGSTLAEVRKAYGASRVHTFTWEGEPAASGFGVGSLDHYSLAGQLTGGRVSHLEAGAYCGE